ncbi:MAG: glycogen-binding domain-containing protein [Candidatus Omnitrophica bacterium]|nr:glycogen-binding domain-containing protein [Candidatus Omnitrophota bacterium]MDD5552599.1 glycogen-binding domain-containing protein [Candidatus Omnitrophota bacterium]
MAVLIKSKPTEFKFYAPQAKRVHLAGSFNNWDTKMLSAKKDTKGNWKVKVNLKPGKYEYKFLVDGSWINDPHCGSCVSNSFGTQNCTIVIK